MKKFAIAITVIGVLALAGGAYAGGRWVVSNINQIKPSVRAQLKGNRGPQGSPGQSGAVPQIVLRQSQHITLNPGQSSYDVAPNNFQASCPAGYTVLGTGFSGPFPSTGGFVQNYGTFVGGFFANESSIPLSDVYLQATCGSVPGGYTGQARDVSSESSYQAQLRQEAAHH